MDHPEVATSSHSLWVLRLSSLLLLIGAVGCGGPADPPGTSILTARVTGVVTAETDGSRVAGVEIQAVGANPKGGPTCSADRLFTRGSANIRVATDGKGHFSFLFGVLTHGDIRESTVDCLRLIAEPPAESEFLADTVYLEKTITLTGAAARVDSVWVEITISRRE